jgi:hypothetical protein
MLLLFFIVVGFAVALVITRYAALSSFRSNGVCRSVLQRYRTREGRYLKFRISQVQPHHEPENIFKERMKIILQTVMNYWSIIIIIIIHYQKSCDQFTATLIKIKKNSSTK